MATKPETTFYTGVNKHLPRTLHREKMNNPYRGGTADFWYSGLVNDQWVEYKWIPYTPRSEFIPDLSPLQIKWLRERHSEGRRVAVIIGCPTGCMILHDLTWELATRPDFALTRQDAANWITKRTCHAAQIKNARNSSKGDLAHV